MEGHVLCNYQYSNPQLLLRLYYNYNYYSGNKLSLIKGKTMTTVSNWEKDLDRESSAYSFASYEGSTCRSLAGPGTGKTFSLMRKIAYLLEERSVDPEKILVITFTRAGAADIQKELSKLEIPSVDKIQAKTLHSFCLGVLIHQDALNIFDRFPRPMLEYEITPMLQDISFDGRFGKMKQQKKMLKDYESAWARLQMDIPGFEQSEDDKEFQNRINTWMEYHKAMTIGEIIPFAYQFMRANPRHHSYHRFEYVLVDEYQDLNKAEQVVIDKISDHVSLTVVGDDNQSIYSFKNAYPDGIREFVTLHDPCNDIPMQECRRCPKRIVKIADDLIKHDSQHNTGASILLPFKENGEGEVNVIQWNTFVDEASGIANIVKKLLEKNPETLTPEDVLILDPSKKIARLINDQLNSIGIPSQFVSKSIDQILNNDTTKWIYSFISFLAYENDFVSFRYLLQRNNNFYCEKYKEISDVAKQQNMSPTQIFQAIATGAIEIPGINTNTAIIKRYTELYQQINEWKQFENVDEFLTKLTSLCEDEGIALLNRIINLIPEFNLNEEDKTNLTIRIARFLAKNIVDIVSANEDTIENDKVRIMTCHSAKGLSGKLVIVASCVEGLIPRILPDSSIKQIDEQRRLFYVALTRCEYTEGNFPGKLILSSFTSIQRGQKRNLGINTNGNGVSASRFIVREIAKEILPETERGEEFLDNL